MAALRAENTTALREFHALDGALLRLHLRHFIVPFFPCRSGSPCFHGPSQMDYPWTLPIEWWWGKDSNLGRRKPADLQSALVDRLSIPPQK